MELNSKVEAVVKSVEGRGTKEYVVTQITTVPKGSRLGTDTTVTFSMSEYKGKHAPKKGQVVLLADIEWFAKGWRARSAEPVRA